MVVYRFKKRSHKDTKTSNGNIAKNVQGSISKTVCVTLNDFIPIIKQNSQFLIKGKLFLERKGERDAVGI